MFSILVFFNIVIIFILFYFSGRFFSSALKHSALNPINFFALFNIFFILDFIVLYLTPVIELYEEPIDINHMDIIIGYSYYLSCLLVVSIAIFTVLNSSKHTHTSFILYSMKTIKKSQTSLIFLIIFILNIVLWFLMSTHLNSLLSAEISRQDFFTENKLMLIIYSMLAPALAFYLGNNKQITLFTFIIILLSSLFILLTGSRGGVILIFLIFAFHVNNIWFRISVIYYFLAIPIMTYVLLYLRYIFREAWRHDSLSDFLDEKGGVLSVFFNTAEISMAEVIVTIVKKGHEISRYPFESFIGGIMYPLPRSIFEFKPLGAGGAFTEHLSPLRWENSHSEIVTTGFGDLYLQFGWILSLIIIFLLGYIWTKAIVISIKLLGNKSVFIVPFLMWWSYMFLRSGIFNTFGSIWSYILVLSTLLLFSQISKRINFHV